MDFLTLILETYREEFDLNLKEGLIKTTPAGHAMSILKNQLKDCEITKPEKNKNKFNVKLAYPKDEDVNEVLTFTNNLGWFPAWFNYIDRRGVTISNKWEERVFKVVNYLKDITITFEAKYDFSVDKVPELLYHIAPAKNWSKIQSIGLVAKSRSKSSTHPGRVYLAKTKDDAKRLGQSFYDKTKETKWVVLEIITGLTGGYLTLYQDPNYQGKGFYTFNNIPALAIRNIEDLTIN